MTVNATSWVTYRIWHRTLLSLQRVGTQTSSVIIYSLSVCLNEDLPTCSYSVQEAMVSRFCARCNKRKCIFMAKTLEFQI